MTDDIAPDVREARAEVARANGAGLKRALAEETEKAQRAPSSMTSARAESEAWNGVIRRAFSGVPLSDGLPTLFETQVDRELDEIRTMLLAKNQAYGNSALDPVRCFSKASTVEQLNVRLDDKISRLMRGENAGEDVDLDLIGYLVLRRIAMRG